MDPFPLERRDAAQLDRPLAGWRKNVGGHVALDLAAPRASGGTLVVLSWNAWIGRGDIAGLVERVRRGEWEGFPAGAPFVALIQEAYRADDTIPEAASRHVARDFSRHGDYEHEISAVARQLGLNLRYAPSMRNGLARSDRGNAILSDLPLTDAVATELPFSMQRRTVVSATIAAGDWRLRLHAAHLDPRGAAAIDLLGFAGRLRQAHELLRLVKAAPELPHLVGADLNLAREEREPAFRALRDAGFVTSVPPGPVPWRHTYHRLPRLRLDWILVTGHPRVRRFGVRRLDEHPLDKGPFVFGSDHHPLLARLDFA